MILPRYRIAPSRIAGAGQGLFPGEAVAYSTRDPASLQAA